MSPLPLPAKDMPKALLGLALERRLAGQSTAGGLARVTVTSPWDVWWASYRAALPFSELDVEPRLPHGACRRCVADALEGAGLATSRNQVREKGAVSCPA